MCTIRLYLQTKLSNPHYKPEIAAQTTLVNFCVTEKVRRGRSPPPRTAPSAAILTLRCHMPRLLFSQPPCVHSREHAPPHQPSTLQHNMQSHSPPQGLEDQLLALVVNHERPDLQEQAAALVAQLGQYTITLKELEDSLLTRLSNAQVQGGGWRILHQLLLTSAAGRFVCAPVCGEGGRLTAQAHTLTQYAAAATHTHPRVTSLRTLS